MGYMKTKDGIGILGTNSKVPITKVGPNEGVSYISDTTISRELKEWIFFKKNGCEAEIHTKKNHYSGIFCSSFKVYGPDPVAVNFLVKKCKLFLGGKEIFLPSMELKSFRDRLRYLLNWLLKGENI